MIRHGISRQHGAELLVVALLAPLMLGIGLIQLGLKISITSSDIESRFLGLTKHVKLKDIISISGSLSYKANWVGFMLDLHSLMNDLRLYPAVYDNVHDVSKAVIDAAYHANPDIQISKELLNAYGSPPYGIFAEIDSSDVSHQEPRFTIFHPDLAGEAEHLLPWSVLGGLVFALVPYFSPNPSSLLSNKAQAAIFFIMGTGITFLILAFSKSPKLALAGMVIAFIPLLLMMLLGVQL